MSISKQDKLTEATQLKLLQQSQRAEINALAAALRSQGLSNDEVNSALKAEKTANSTEYNNFKKQTKQDGIQYFSSTTDANGNLVVNPVTSTSSTYSGDTANSVNNTLNSARDLYNTYNLSQVRQIAGDGSYSGVGLDQLTNAVLNQNSDGTFNKGSGSTALYDSTYKLLSDATSNYGKTLTSDEVGKVKLVGQDANGNEIYQHNLHRGDNTSYSLLTKNADGTYTNIGYTATRVPEQDGGFLSSPLGKIALGVGAALTGGALAPAVAGALGTSTAIGGALAGAATGGLTSGITGNNILTGAALGGLGGYAGSGGFDGIGSTNAAQSFGTDYLGSSALGDASTGAVGSGSTNFGINPNAGVGINAGTSSALTYAPLQAGASDVFANTVTQPYEASTTPITTGNEISYDWNTINTQPNMTAVNAANAAGAAASNTPSYVQQITGGTDFSNVAPGQGYTSQGGPIEKSTTDLSNVRKLANALSKTGQSFANAMYPQTGIGQGYSMPNPFFTPKEVQTMLETKTNQPVYLGQLAQLLRG